MTMTETAAYWHPGDTTLADKDRLAVTGMLRLLGDDGATVAGSLIILGVTGCTDSASGCPLAVYLNRYLGGDFLVLADQATWINPARTVDAVMPWAATEFVARFDAGEYPELFAQLDAPNDCTCGWAPAKCCEAHHANYCPTCGRNITDTDNAGCEAISGQRYCLNHLPRYIDPELFDSVIAAKVGR